MFLLNELKLRTSPTASVKVLDLLEQLLPPKLTRMSRGGCWLWRVVKTRDQNTGWLVYLLGMISGIILQAIVRIQFLTTQAFMVHLPGGFWSLLKRIWR